MNATLPRSFSTYLDLLRAAAAFTVFLAHAAYFRFSHGAIRMPEHLAHEAVIVFFVLSGYVIAYVADVRETRLPDYLIARAARIYSVAIPALALTFLVDVWLLHVGAADHVPAYQIHAPWKYLPLFLSFTTDAWFLNEDAFSDAPYWSLCYEVWYYLVFAAALFLRGRQRAMALVAGLLVMGPRAWLLLPIWLAGVRVYRLHARTVVVGGRGARWLFAASLLGLAGVWGGGIDSWLDHTVNALSDGWTMAHLRYSQFFLGDWLSGCLLALNIHAARSIGLEFGELARPIARVAAYSFALYLLHYPLLEFFSRFDWPVPILLGVVLLSVWIIGRGTERQKNVIRARLRKLVLARAPVLASRA